MYGLQINNIILNKAIYGFSHKLNNENFTSYKGKIGQYFLNIPTDGILECIIGDILDYKVFAKKRSPFSNMVRQMYQGVDAGFSGVRTLDMLFIEYRNNKIIVVTDNPNDWDILVFAKYEILKNEDSYGIRVYDTYNSKYPPCILSNSINLNTLLKDESSITRWGKYLDGGGLKRGGRFENIFQIKQDKIVCKNSEYLELGISAFFNKKFNGDHFCCYYQLLSDSTNLIKFVPICGYGWGLHYYRDRDNFNANVKYLGNIAGIIKV